MIEAMVFVFVMMVMSMTVAVVASAGIFTAFKSVRHIFFNNFSDGKFGTSRNYFNTVLRKNHKRSSAHSARKNNADPMFGYPACTLTRNSLLRNSFLNV